MTDELSITLKTLTPLWTGGVDQSADRLHETGLLGSLRWWYEALVRGLGGYACDPTEHACQFDEEKYRKSKATNERDRLREAGVCDGCQLFGCTGWTRKFRLSVSPDGQKLLGDQQNVLIPSGRKHQTRRGERAGGWFVFSESRIGEIAFELTSLRDADLRPIHTILALISRYASLGAKGASGYGVIQADIKPDLAWIQGFGNQPPARNSTLPDFRDFFFARFKFQEPTGNTNWWQNINGIRQAVNGQLDDHSSPNPLRQAKKELEQMKQQGILPIAPAIRNWLRYHWQHNLNPNLALDDIFGDARSAIGSKILVSYAYCVNSAWEFRIWGWLPCSIFNQNNRDTFLQSLCAAFGQNALWKFVFGESQITPTLTEWHALTCDQTDGKAYLNALFGGAK